MAEDWDVFMRNVDGFPAVVFTDLLAAQEADEALRRPRVVRVAFPLQNPGDDGLGIPDETDVLYAIEDELFAKLCTGDAPSRYVGRVTTQGRREAFYYAMPDGDPQALAATAFQDYPAYSPTVSVELDPGWSIYRQRLLPGDLERHSIENRRLIDYLQENGDDPNVPRSVEHFAHFATGEDRDRFAKQVVANGYLAEPVDTVEGVDPSLPCGLKLTRVHQVTLEIMDPLTADLYFRAQDCGGRYDGWGSPVCTGP